jgi:small subunit ribosomal protein S6
MSDLQQRLYEGMFLVNPTAISASVSAAADEVRRILDRGHAQVEALYRWDDRRLAFPIEGQKRGIYFVAYFRATGAGVAHIESDVNYSETVLRCLVTRADHIGDVELDLARQQERTTRDTANLESAGAHDRQPAHAAAGNDEQDSDEPRRDR